MGHGKGIEMIAVVCKVRPVSFRAIFPKNLTSETSSRIVHVSHRALASNVDIL